MSETFTYPTSAELVSVAQDKMPRLIQDRPCFKLLPPRSVNDFFLMWEQMDNFQGIQQVRGLDGQPQRVKRVGIKRYLMEPGVYGEYLTVSERELTIRRAQGTFGTPIDISDLVMMLQDQLLQRRLDRVESQIWTLLLTGTFTVKNAEGLTVHTDTFPLQSYAASTPWSTWASATPLLDMRTMQLKHRGHSVAFDRRSTLYLNQKTVNDMLFNTNAADLYGRRTAGVGAPGSLGGTLNTLDDVNKIFMMENLPQVQPYDESYLSDGTDGNAAGTVVLYIPNGEGVLVGARPAGQTVGEFRFCRNANTPAMGDGAPGEGGMGSGPYMRVIDRGEFQVPRSIEVHDGYNGGPAIYYPTAIISVSGL